jgi:hypothetical protein
MIIPAGALNVVTPVLRTKVIVWPAVIVAPVVKVRPDAIVLYPLPVFHCTVTVYVVLGVAPALIVMVAEYCQFPATVAVVTVPPFAHVAGKVVAVAALWVTTNPLLAALKPPATLYTTPCTDWEVVELIDTLAAKETTESTEIIRMGTSSLSGVKCLRDLILFMNNEMGNS